MKTFDQYTQDELLDAMRQPAAQMSPVKARLFRLQMQNDGLVLQQDEARIMGYISEFGAIEWQTGNRAICLKTANTLGFEASGNCKAVIDRLLHDGLIEPVTGNGQAYMVMTKTGSDMLDLHEIEEEIETAWDDGFSIMSHDEFIGGLFSV